MADSKRSTGQILVSLVYSIHEFSSTFIPRQRQGDLHGGAATDHALRVDGSPVRLDDGFGDCQPQAGFAVFGVAGRIRPVEAFKDIREMLRADPGPGILHAELHALGGLLRPQRDRPTG